jgi:uncharacterized membrane protein
MEIISAKIQTIKNQILLMHSYTYLYSIIVMFSITHASNPYHKTILPSGFVISLHANVQSIQIDFVVVVAVVHCKCNVQFNDLLCVKHNTFGINV